jgi:glycosyltransferase involved in cell wall biosynthesis
MAPDSAVKPPLSTKTTDLPLVSIITPSFNQGKYLEQTMLSVLEQDYPRIEYIVIDGGSTDSSVSVIQKYASRLAFWVSEKDRGQTDAINKGFSRAKGEILAWLNSDDVYNPGAVAEAVAYLQSHPQIGMVYGDLDFIDERDRVIGKFNAVQTDLPKLRRGFVHIPQPAAFFRAEHWRAVGPLDPTFFFAMDYDLWVRLAGVTEMKYLPDRPWAKFRLHSDAKTISADDRCWPEMLRVHYRDGGSRFAPIVFKYHLRRLVSPLINLRRKRMFRN